jgi:hypothetical protein
LKDRKSTLGFEILNEPEVFLLRDYYKVDVYHDFMVKEIRKITDKPLPFCWALSHGVVDNPILQALVAPARKIMSFIMVTLIPPQSTGWHTLDPCLY